MACVQHRTNFPGSTAILHYQQISACRAFWMCGLVCAFASTLYHAFTPFCGKHSVNTLYLYHLISAKDHLLLAFRGNPSMSSLWWIFGWEGSGPKVIWSEHSCPHQKNQESNPHRDSGSVWQSYPENKVTGRVKQESTKMITSAIKTQALVHSMSGINTTAIYYLSRMKP